MQKFRTTARKNGVCLTLPPVLDLRAAKPLQEGLRKVLAKGSPVLVDAGAVERLSTPCIQLLIAAVAAATREGISLTLLHPSDAFIDAFNDLGLFAVLKQWKIEG